MDLVRDERYETLHMNVVFEDGRVIDRDLDEDVLLNRVWQTEFAISRREQYQIGRASCRERV